MSFPRFPVRLLLVVALLLVGLLPVLAAATDVIPVPVAGTEVAKLPQGDILDVTIPTVTKLMVYALGITSFIIFSVAGVMYVTAFGNQEQTKKATQIIIWGIVGLGFAAAAYALVKGVLGFQF